MPEQHIFVKSSLGLATYSKSPELDEVFIDTYIRQYCAPIYLYYLEEKSSAGYKCAIPLSNGGLLYMNGCKSKKEPFVYIHSYAVMPSELSEFSKNASSFVCSPPESTVGNHMLFSVKKMPESGKKHSEFKENLNLLSITSSEYLTALAAVFASAEQHRNVFIAHGKKSALKSSSELMFRLYEYLPYYLRGKIGYSTFFSEEAMKPEINIYFVPSEIIVNNREMSYVSSHDASKDYIFNFAEKSYAHIQELREDLAGDYLCAVAKSIRDGSDMKDFFDFADEASINISPERKLSLRFYDDLYCVYDIANSEDTVLSKSGRITVIYIELIKSDAGHKVLSSYSEFIRLYRRALKQKGVPMPLEILKRLVMSYDFCPAQQKEELYDLISLDIDICLKSGGDESVFTHVDAVRSSQALYNVVTEKKMSPSNRLIKSYFTYLTEQKKTVHSVMEFAGEVFSDMPQIADNEIIQKMLYEKTLELYDTSGDRFEAVKYLDTKCADLSSTYPTYVAFFSAIYNYALTNYMNELDVSELSCQQIHGFPLRNAEEINDECRIKHRVVLALKEILALTDDVAMSFIQYDAFGFDNVQKNLSDDLSLAKAAELQLKSKLLKCITETKDAPRRMIYTILYYIFENRDARVPNDFDSIYAFIDRELKCQPFEFIEWYLSSKLFIAPVSKNGRIIREANGARADLTALTAFYESTRRYFLSHGELLANERNMKKLKKELDHTGLAHPDYRQLTQEFRHVLNGIMRTSYSPLRRMADRIISSKNFKFLLVVIALCAIIVTGFIIGSKIALNTAAPEILTTASFNRDMLVLDRTCWSAVKCRKDGEFVQASGCIDGTEKNEIFDFTRDSELIVSFEAETGLTVNALSVALSKSEGDSGIDVYVITSQNKRLFVSVSDYDIESGAAVYSFKNPTVIKKIILCPKNAKSEGIASIREINAFCLR